jgi:8-oxo-dGTP pyrophosphatase MutT (NUDIX family)
MYKFFVNDKPLFLTNEVQKETDFQLFLLESIDIKELIIKIFKNKVDKAFLYHPDEKEMLKKLKAKIPVEKAGGGLVYNAKDEVLFIYRNNKWDLPKGGIEKGEEIEETAIREVEEETGVKGLTIVNKTTGSWQGHPTHHHVSQVSVFFHHCKFRTTHHYHRHRQLMYNRTQKSFRHYHLDYYLIHQHQHQQ